MSVFKRLFTWGKAEAHAVVDRIEDPIKMADQGIRDLRADLTKALESLAQVKAQAIRTRREAQQGKEAAADYEKKAMLLLQRGQSGQLPAGEADRLAGEALAKRDGAVQRASILVKELEGMDRMTAQLETNVQSLKTQISKWENELQTLKARAQVSHATRKLNEQLAKVDPSGTISMLERMKDKVQAEESLAEAYGEMAQVERSVDHEIEAALATPAGAGAGGAAALADLKARMGLGQPLTLGSPSPVGVPVRE